MFDEPFRARFAPAVAPVARRLARLGVTANAVTVASCLVGCGAAVLIGTGHPRLGIVTWIISRLGDGLDGVVARESGQSSAFGGYLDITLDMVAYAAMVLGFERLHPDVGIGWSAVLAAYIVVITTTLALSDAAQTAQRAVSATNRTFQFTRGLAEAGETTTMYILWVLFPSQVWWLVWVWVSALLITSSQRTLLARRTL
ncbi:MAG TPA: CDP-alcohol phosphatidyltransferase family protein [Vicinamibacterales bacterium]|nr:CDP-alcohol phosphatidyltransferase family protein [Vicinamibacterales bacterium]